MARSELGSRPIVVDGIPYRWRVPRYPVGEDQGLGWSPLTFSVWLAGESGSLLEVEACAARPDNWLHYPATVITPGRVADLIRRAIAAGWEPSRSGASFKLEDTTTLIPATASPARPAARDSGRRDRAKK